MEIFKLEIEDELFAETGTFLISLVSTPAHLTSFMYFANQEFEEKSFDDYPQYMVEAAKKALKWLDENGNPNGCLTPVGRRRAWQLANRQPISLDTIKRMWSYIQRHKVDLQTSKSYDDGCGLLAMDSWGSVQAENWIESVLRKEGEFNTEILLNYDENYDEDYEMVEGIIELLNQVDDIENRKQIAKDVIKDFASEGISYDYENFLMRIGLLGKMDFQQYAEEADALEEATLLGCSGAHKTELGWTPCQTQEEYEKLVSTQMSCDEHCRTQEMVDSVSTTIETLLDNGRILIDDTELTQEMAQEIHKEMLEKLLNDNTQKFYTIKSKPNAPSMLDTPGRVVRFIFVAGPGRLPLQTTSRKLCKQMIGDYQLVYRYEDIVALSMQLEADAQSYKLVPRPKGTSVDQFTWKNGANCAHIWRQLIFTEEDPYIVNNALVAEEEAQLQQPATGQSGMVNPPAVHTSMSSQEIPVSYYGGLPIFRSEITAESHSQKMGCKGVFKTMEYRGEMGYIPCMKNEGFNAIKQNQSFSINEEKRIITGPAAIPNKLIVRLADDNTEGVLPGQKYYVYFDKETIYKMSQRFLMEQRILSSNLEHNGGPLEEVYLVESWIIETPMDKAYGMGFSREECPIGTWMVSYRIDNDDIWNNYVKKNKVSGWSIEGVYMMNADRQNQNHSKQIMDDIIKILKQVEL